MQMPIPQMVCKNITNANVWDTICHCRLPLGRINHLHRQLFAGPSKFIASNGVAIESFEIILHRWIYFFPSNKQITNKITLNYNENVFSSTISNNIHH